MNAMKQQNYIAVVIILLIQESFTPALADDLSL